MPRIRMSEKWTTKPGLQKDKSRADKVPDPKHRCILAPVFRRMRQIQSLSLAGNDT
jgi:hypothetical protein